MMPAQTIEPLHRDYAMTVLDWIAMHPWLTLILIIVGGGMLSAVIQSFRMRKIQIEPIEVKHTLVIKRVD